ncbi:MAG: laccase domain-containing protein, partial [Burkholderiaceae bacterium]|nr:laccase domain-containing protein [Burkholderiaceae bacterium]
MSEQWIRPDWPVPANVRALITTRAGGVSRGPYGASIAGRDGMNVGLASGDDVADVAENRARLRARLPTDPRWLHQVHGALVVDAAQQLTPGSSRADASFTDAPNVVCV